MPPASFVFFIIVRSTTDKSFAFACFGTYPFPGSFCPDQAHGRRLSKYIRLSHGSASMALYFLADDRTGLSSSGICLRRLLPHFPLVLPFCRRIFFMGTDLWTPHTFDSVSHENSIPLTDRPKNNLDLSASPTHPRRHLYAAGHETITLWEGSP